jgi:hypothetical protein
MYIYIYIYETEKRKCENVYCQKQNYTNISNHTEQVECDFFLNCMGKSDCKLKSNWKLNENLTHSVMRICVTEDRYFSFT